MSLPSMPFGCRAEPAGHDGEYMVISPDGRIKTFISDRSHGEALKRARELSANAELLEACETARTALKNSGWMSRPEAGALKSLDAAIEKARRGEGEAKMPAEVAAERPAAEYRMDEATARIEEIDAELMQLKQERDHVVDVAMEARELLLKKAAATAHVIKGSDKHATASPRSASDEQLARLAELADEIYEEMDADMADGSFIEWLQRAWTATDHMSEVEADELIAELEAFAVSDPGAGE